MRLVFWCLLICALLSLFVDASVSKNSMDKLGFHDYSDIVRDLIKSWESPIVYLRQLGYLPSDYEDTSKIKPNLDALMSRIEQNDQQAAQEEENKSKELQDKKKRASMSKLENYRQQREAVGNPNLNYPYVDQLMKMAQQYKELLPQQLQAAKDQISAKQNSNVEMLQRLVERTSPNIKPKQTVVAAEPVGKAQFAVMPQSKMEPTEMLQLLSSNAVKKPTNMLAKSLSGFSGIGDNSAMSIRKNEAQSTCKFQPEIESPQYLNWDIGNKRLKQISPFAKDEYVDKLVQIFVKRQKTLDILQSTQNNQ